MDGEVVAGLHCRRHSATRDVGTDLDWSDGRAQIADPSSRLV